MTSSSTAGKGILTASIILTIMAVPIIASVARELFTTIPRTSKTGARALGATRWEVVRGVVLHYTRPGLAAAVILGLGRALGEAIAVTQVIGGTVDIPRSLFATGDTLASRIAGAIPGRGVESPGLVALLPGRDPARLLASSSICSRS